MGDLSFEDVQFTYPSRTEAPILKVLVPFMLVGSILLLSWLASK